MQQLQFLLRVTPAALASQRDYGIPACVTIAQAILESATPQFGWGSSVLFRMANNPFGIKYCHFPWGDRGMGPARDPAVHPNSGAPGHPIPQDYGHFDATTWEIENGQKKAVFAEFQRFPNLEEAFRCHAFLLARLPRYGPAMQAMRAAAGHDQADQAASAGGAEGGSGPAVRRPDYPSPPPAWQKFAERLGPPTSALDTEHCGYSTNPSYSAELVKLVRLYRLDDPRAIEWYATGRDPGPAILAARQP